MLKPEALPIESLGSFEPSVRRPFPLAGKVFALLCIPVVIAAVYFSPTLTSLGWHLIHGKAIDYRGLHVEVPWGWTADLSLIKEDYAANPQGITLQKPPKTLNIESRGPELIYVNLLLPDGKSTPQQQAAEWDSLFRGSHPASLFDVRDAAGTPSDVNCVEAVPRGAADGPASAALACISLKQGWLATYAGMQVHVPMFFHVISGLKH